MKNVFLVIQFMFSFAFTTSFARELSDKDIPKVYKNIIIEDGNPVFVDSESNKKYYLNRGKHNFTVKNFINPAIGTDNGIEFDFGNSRIEGILYYGLFQENSSKFKFPIYLNSSSKVNDGKASINISDNLSGKKDISNWQKTGITKLGYRLVDKSGNFIYDGKIVISGKGPFNIEPHIIEGPFINKVTDSSGVISFSTNIDTKVSLIVNNREFADAGKRNYHEINITGLRSNTEYKYSIKIGDYEESYSFRTNPHLGSKEKFRFAFSSDSRKGFGGGERDIYGSNVYVMKKSAALANKLGAKFFQFTGDMITGYLDNYDASLLQYRNFKRGIEQFAAYMPFNYGMGNHENIGYIFDDKSQYGLAIDRFPFADSSSESAFSEVFVGFDNGPDSEDNSKYDPYPNSIDFPKYNEQVYYYIVANTAMIVLNSNYLYTPSSNSLDKIGGNLHGYIMDNQLEWLDGTVEKLEKDKNIDNIFVTIHTPAFPNGGHAYDAMWYDGNNSYRPVLFGKKTEMGIIERRDEFLNILCNKTSKVVALLTGDEHNYSRMLVSNKIERYPANWSLPKLEIKNPIWQLINGAAGAPYYSQEKLPWSDAVEFFTAEHILCIIEVDGKNVNLEVHNPETLELLETVKLR